MEGKKFHHWCATHVINLVVKEDLKNVSEAISKIHDNSVCYTKSTPSRKKSFQEAIDIFRMESQALPSVDVPTRWNLRYLMLKLALPYQKVFDQLLVQDPNYVNCPTSQEWEEIATMQDFLSIFHSGKYFILWSCLSLSVWWTDTNGLFGHFLFILASLKQGMTR